MVHLDLGLFFRTLLDFPNFGCKLRRLRRSSISRRLLQILDSPEKYLSGHRRVTVVCRGCLFIYYSVLKLMNNFAILGPNNLLNRSFRKPARKLVRETIDRNWFRNAYKLSNRHYIVVNTGGSLVGFALINRNHRNQRGDVRIRLIGTNKGRGIGRLLMERIIANARARGLKTVTLEAVPEARGFYNKLGFRPIGIGSNMRFNIQRSPSRPSPRRSSLSPRTSPPKRARR
jgi:GNAT superfamily N-acetyltransferase